MTANGEKGKVFVYGKGPSVLVTPSFRSPRSSSSAAKSDDGNVNVICFVRLGLQAAFVALIIHGQCGGGTKSGRFFCISILYLGVRRCCTGTGFIGFGEKFHILPILGRTKPWRNINSEGK